MYAWRAELLEKIDDANHTVLPLPFKLLKAEVGAFKRICGALTDSIPHPTQKEARVFELRQYQTEAVHQIEGHRRPLLVAPTGSGKTVIAAEVINRAPNSHVLFFAHRRELVTQARSKLKEVGIQAGTILAGEPVNMMARVQVASVQTLTARCIRGEQDLPPAQMVIVDEAHHCPANTYRELLGRYPEAQIVGMTATPCRRDGRGLGSLFDALVECPQIPELIGMGYLVGTKVYAPTIPNLKGVKTRHGDYVESQLAERMDPAELSATSSPTGSG